ncbi:patatin-like phospholipase family protein [Aspergillus undulatus]|uniref:patatin-like phospholipase family protein n=1 Tax=Aspergillus undulatus TaxID=1810928 RepID=UPI003CCD0899
MSQVDEIGWLDVGERRDHGLFLQDHGRLKRVLAESGSPESKYPALCAFLGHKAKDAGLRQIYPQNNIKRHHSSATVRLRRDIRSCDLNRPRLIVDGHLTCSSPSLAPEHTPEGYSITWDALSKETVMRAAWARLIFLFSDLVCIFVADFPSPMHVADFLLECINLGAASTLPTPVRPRIAIVFDNTARGTVDDVEAFHQRLNTAAPTAQCEVFSAVNTICLDPRLSETARYEQLSAFIAGQLDDMSAVRQDHHALFNANHLMALFGLAAKHFAQEPSLPFNVLEAVRVGNPVPRSLTAHLAHYQEVAMLAGVGYEQLAPSIASALIMDHYKIGMPVFAPRMVFQALYRSAVVLALKRTTSHQSARPLEELTGMVECRMVEQFDQLERMGFQSWRLRQEQLRALSGHLSSIRSNRICLFCLIQSAQHRLECGHTLCDHCAQVYGSPASEIEYRFTVSVCLCCLYQKPFTVDVLPPTANPTVLAIDGGGVRGVIPLEFLVLVQEHLGRSCPLQNMIDLAIGTSSGGLSVLALFKRLWDVKTCTGIFDKMARQIFEEKQSSPLSRAFQAMLGDGSLLGRVHKWFLWLLYDGCYSGRVFDSVLKEVFGEVSRLFEALYVDGLPITSSRTKFGVVATSIAKETRSFIFGNFNPAQILEEDCGYDIVRPNDTSLEPLAWEGARATAAAPFFFPPIDIPGIGSFQDGGLQDNLAADIAHRLCRQIWPSRKNPAKLLSLGTGIAPRAIDPSPHFQHVFQDGFIRRSFDAWMSSMDTEFHWSRMWDQIEDGSKPDYLRLNVPLPDAAGGIDAVEVMEEYRNLVLFHPGAARMAREAATALLASQFFFLLDSLPEEPANPFWCHGTVRCRGHAKTVVAQLNQLYPDGLFLSTDTQKIGSRVDGGQICGACGRYRQAVSFVTAHSGIEVNIYLESQARKRWRISGFPDSLASFGAKQHLHSPFGRPDFHFPSAACCTDCDHVDTQPRGKRRRRGSADKQAKRARIQGDNDTSD